MIDDDEQSFLAGLVLAAFAVAVMVLIGYGVCLWAVWQSCRMFIEALFASLAMVVAGWGTWVPPKAIRVWGAGPTQIQVIRETSSELDLLSQEELDELVIWADERGLDSIWAVEVDPKRVYSEDLDADPGVKGYEEMSPQYDEL